MWQFFTRLKAVIHHPDRERNRAMMARDYSRLR
jgi:hypothetical protein